MKAIVFINRTIAYYLRKISGYQTRAIELIASILPIPYTITAMGSSSTRPESTVCLICLVRHYTARKVEARPIAYLFINKRIWFT
jgi:hypothetical protein